MPCEGAYTAHLDTDLAIIARCKSIRGSSNPCSNAGGYGGYNFKMVDCPGLESLGGTSLVENNEYLTTLEIPKLTTVTGWMEISLAEALHQRGRSR